MSTLEIIASLREIGVVPRLQDGNLKLVGKTAALSAELLAAVRDGKAKLLAFLEESQADTRQEQITPITQQAHYPLTPSQRRMWVLSQFDGGNQAYNIGNGFYLQGEVNATVLEEAFRVCIAKHESLRTTFAEVADEPVQVVHDELPFALEQTTLVGSADVKAALRQEYSALYHHQFNLEQGPLMQVKLIHLGGESHALLFNMHHIISDGWSVGLLVQEVMGYYREKCLGNSITTQALSIQYKDYAAWLAEKFDGSFGQKAKAYWQGKQLEGVEPLVLPYDRPRPQQTTFAGASTRMYLSPSQKEALDQLARQQHTTLFNLYRALLSLTLHKVSGQDQLILGTPIAGRSVMQLHDQIGLYVNTLPLYSQITSATPFTAYLKELSRDSLDTFNYQDYPLDRIIEDVGVARDASRGALFDVMMVVQNTALGDGSIDIKKQHGFEMSYLYEYLEGGQKVDKEDVSAKFDMALEFSQDIEGRPYVEWEYNTDLFDKATIQRLQRAFGFVMQQVLDQPELSVDEVMLIDPKEQDTILHVFNQPIGEVETHSLVHLLQPAIAKHADRVAVRDAHNALTYGELWQQAQGYAQAILQSTEAPRVGIYMQRSVEILPAILGVLLAGKTYVPIDVKYPEERVRYIAEDASLSVAITDAASASTLQTICPGITTLVPETLSSSAEVPAIEADLREQPAYLIYTSGSTGKPKGVMITHRNVVAFLNWAQQEFKETPYSVMFAATSYCFDLSIFEMFLPLLQGKPIRVLDNALHIPEYLGQESNIFINTVPSVVRTLLDEGVAWDRVVALNMAGEPVPHIFRDQLDYERMEVRNLYGPSEDTTYSTFYRFRADGRTDVPIGVAVGDTHAYVMDRHQKLVPIGVEGEICLSGESIAQGYLGRPELTAERFIENPYQEGRRLYRTGDVGKWTEDGQLLFVGRMDDQVKIRGYRIELGEVQYHMESVAGVDQAVVLVLPVRGEDSLVAYWSGTDVTPSHLEAALQEAMPAFMQPSVVMQLDEIPLNSNGKVDKRRLPTPEAPEVTGDAIQPPTTDMENALWDIWREVLQREDFGITHNFFELGGHSLKATRVRSMVKNRLQKELTLNELFRHLTIAELAPVVSEKADDTPDAQTFHPIEEAEDAPVPLSFTQERLWVLTNFEEASRAYHMPAAFRVTGTLNVPQLQAAIEHVMDRHESLRTVFKEIEGQPQQVVLPRSEMGFSVEESSLPEGTALKTFLVERWQAPFSLTDGPLVRCEVIHTTGGQILSFNMHHIISDGWSLGVLVAEVTQAYIELPGGQAIASQPLSIQYKDFARWQRQLFTDAYLQEQLAYWQQEVFADGVPVLELPTDHPRPEVKTYRGGILQHTFSAEIADGLKKLAAEEGATLFMALLAQVNLLLKKLSNQDTLVVGTPVSGRDQGQLHDQIGFYVNTLPIKNTLAGSDSFRTLVGQHREQLLEAFDHQQFPFELLVEALQPRRDLSRSPLFDVMVVMQNFDGPQPNALAWGGDTHLEKLGFNSEVTKYDLTFSFAEGVGGIELELEYNSDLYEPASAQRLIDQLQRVMALTLAAPEVPVAEVSLLSQEAWAQVQSRFDQSSIGYQKDETIVSRFAKMARTYPDREALVVGEKSITYAELDAKSGALARTLVHTYGVQPEELIVLHTDRSEWMLVAILGVLKAGAAYVPVDPAYPASRIQYIVEDSAARLVLTDQELSGNTLALMAAQQVVMLPEVDYAQTPIQVSVAPYHLAYVIYTSGTTGKPKGVLVEHRNVHRLFFTEQPLFDFNEQDRWSLFHSYCFDFSVWEMYGALLYGGAVVMVPKEVAQSSTAFYDFLATERITVLNQTPTAFRSLATTNEGKLQNHPVPVRYLVFGGEALMPETLKAWHAAFPECTLVNMYGITETTVHVTYKEITQAEIDANQSNIGVPIPTLSCYVLDHDLQPAAVGVVGELCVGGAGVARGYHQREALTAERFIQHPLAGEGRLYRSGDFARLLPNGDLEYIGRKDDQVKIRGHRIELPEVEAAVLKLAGVKDAVVTVRKNAAGEYELIAYLIADEEAHGFREALQAQLPGYMVPSYFVSLQEWPLTSNGKLDKKALPEPESTAQNNYVAPTNDVEARVVAIWEEVLEQSPIGIQDNFFDLGGHSLKATRVLTRIMEEFGVKIDLKNLFIDPTIEHLSQYINTLLWVEAGKEELETEQDELLI